jgi:hypothetical protein
MSYAEGAYPSVKEFDLQRRPTMSQLEPAASPIEEENGEKSSLLMGIIAGALAAIIGAFIWALITMLTKYQIGYMSVGVGFLVGFAVRYAGRGKTIVYGIVGAALSLAGCLVGNFLAMLMMGADETVTFTDLLKYFLANPSDIIVLFQETFEIIDLLFYGIALYCGFRFAMDVQEKKPAIASPPASA